MNVLLQKIAVASSVILFAALNLCQAATIAYNDDTSASNQTLAGFNVGLKFMVNQSIQITSYGAFDSGNVANLVGTEGNGVTVGIYDNTTQSLVAGSTTMTFTPSSPVTTVNGDSFLALATPLTLLPGSYMVVAFDDPLYNDRVNTGNIPNPGPNPHQTQDSGGGLISFLSPNQYLAAGSLSYATHSDANEGSNPNQFMAGTFTLSAVPTPEPGAFILASFGCCGLMAAVRKRRCRRPRGAARAPVGWIQPVH